MKEELISIVITTYNRSDKVEEAIRSAINQTYSNTEIIVIDDNSNRLEERERTKEIIQKFSGIKLIQNKNNLGGALSRNEGIKNAKGNLISFLDDDDIYLPNRIEEMYKEYIRHKDEKIGIVYCNCERIDNSKNIIGSYENHYEGLHLYE